MEDFPSHFGAEIYKAEFGEAFARREKPPVQPVPVLEIVTRYTAVEEGIGLGNESYRRISRPVFVGEVVIKPQV